MALLAVAGAGLTALEGGTGWQAAAILFLVLAVLVGGCAVGTYFNWRAASLVGFAIVFVVLAVGSLGLARSLAGLLFSVPAMAGIVGTFATARLLQSGEAHRQHSTA
jgi:uncharacterized membrane protein (UPF0182 family)